MRRIHRRAHLALWFFIAPAGLAALAVALLARTPTPDANLPPAIASEAP